MLSISLKVAVQRPADRPTPYLHYSTYSFLAWFIQPLWWWRQHIPPKRVKHLPGCTVLHFTRSPVWQQAAYMKCSFFSFGLWVKTNRRLGATYRLRVEYWAKQEIIRALLSTWFTLVSSLAYPLTLKIELTCSSETSSHFHRAACYYVPQNRNLHYHRR
jgi:hypothetical protein